MELKGLLVDEDAVSEVIGVILMVAITVILAAVIGAFVLGFGAQIGNSQPTATFDFDFSETEQDNCNALEQGSAANGALTITHNGGDKINEDRLSLADGDGNKIDDLETCGVAAGTALTTGDSVTPDVDSDDTVKVIWTASGGGDSAPLGEWTGPDA